MGRLCKVDVKSEYWHVALELEIYHTSGLMSIKELTHVRCQVSHIMCRVSPITCHLSNVTNGNSHIHRFSYC